MTPFTLRAVAPLMDIVLLVAGHAGSRRFDCSPHGNLMASIAIHSLMPPIQLETSSRTVIKIPNLPIPGVVAVLTLSSKCPLVDILLVVATHTVRFRVLVLGSQVTFLAFRLCMLA